jgi:hypothetical protein
MKTDERFARSCEDLHSLLSDTLSEWTDGLSEKDKLDFIEKCVPIVFMDVLVSHYKHHQEGSSVDFYSSLAEYIESKFKFKCDADKEIVGRA